MYVDQEKAFDNVPREEVWYCMRTSGLAEKYARIVHDMYDDSKTAVRCAVGVTEGFDVKVGPCMMFADDIVVCSESKEQIEDKLESWRYALERRGVIKSQ